MDKQLRMGIKIEGEHRRTTRFIRWYFKKHKKIPSNKVIFRNIAKDHLKENKRYYSKLKRLKL